jgi:imidazoleglycerol phosphate dehydratase HisB
MVSQGYVNELVKKVLRKQRKSLDITIRASILKKNKHHTSINRLHALAKTIDQTLADKIKAIIKKYGYFIS